MNAQELHRQKLVTDILTAAAAAVLVGILVLTGFEILGPLPLVLLVGFVLWTQFAHGPDRVLLRGARAVGYAEAPELYGLVQELRLRAGLPTMPKLYHVENPVANAMTAGRPESSFIVVTSALVRNLSRRELTAVLAHELAHIRAGDTVLFTLAEVVRRLTTGIATAGWFMLFLFLPALLTGAVDVSSSGILLLIAAPFASLVVQRVLLQSREFAADLAAAEITGDPEGLASALARIEYRHKNWLRYFFPIPAGDGGSLLRTHPDTEERIRRLSRIRPS